MNKILIVIIALVIVAGAAVYFFVFANTADKPEVRVEYSPGEFFTTNVNGSNRLLKTGIVLVVNETGLDEMLSAQNARIRDAIIFILRELTEDQIKETNVQDELRDKIISELNERLGIDNFVEVLFNDFVSS